MTKCLGAYAAVFGGLGAIVFTAGIGGNSAVVHATLCKEMSRQGKQLDEQPSVSGGPRISTVKSTVSVWASLT